MPVSDSLPIKSSKFWFCKSSLMILILVGSSFFSLPPKSLQKFNKCYSDICMLNC